VQVGIPGFKLQRILRSESLALRIVITGPIVDQSSAIVLAPSELKLTRARRPRHLFKREFGISLREYRTRARVLNAAKLVADSDVKIEAIAAVAGFRSKRNFYKAFRQVMGGTPSEFRRREVRQNVVDLRSKEWRAAPRFPAERSL
jgi:hypothetical protein